jgi:hypothetical protein
MKNLTLAVLATLLASCGGGGGLSSGGSIPEEQACSQAATTVCTKIFGCNDSTSALVKIYLMSQANCEASVLQYCGATGFQCSAGATYHGDQAQVCKNQFNAQTCETISAAIGVAVTNMSSASDAIGSLTASLPGCMTICTGGTDAGPG